MLAVTLSGCGGSKKAEPKPSASTKAATSPDAARTLMRSIVDKPVAAAEKMVAAAGFSFRIVSKDQVPVRASMDYDPSRISVVVRDGKIFDAVVF